MRARQMAPAAAAAASLLASSMRPAASVDAEPLVQGDQEEAARKNNNQQQQQLLQLECPRCGSGNTKFCYYNNYSTAQPRHFCRACRRYWTHGGTLRNVPVGGACRRTVAGNSKRCRGVDGSSSSASPPTSARAEDSASYPDLPTTLFPFLSDGAFLPHFELGLGGAAPAPYSWPSSAAPDFYVDGLAAPWNDGALAAAGVTGAWDDFTGLELSYPPPAGN